MKSRLAFAILLSSLLLGTGLPAAAAQSECGRIFNESAQAVRKVGWASRLANWALSPWGITVSPVEEEAPPRAPLPKPEVAASPPYELVVRLYGAFGTGKSTQVLHAYEKMTPEQKAAFARDIAKYEKWMSSCGK